MKAYDEVMSDVKNLTVRLSAEEYSHAKLMAEEQSVSLNQLIKEGLKVLEVTASQKKLFDDFTALGDDYEDNDVEFATEAQAEVVDSNYS